MRFYQLRKTRISDALMENVATRWFCYKSAPEKSYAKNAMWGKAICETFKFSIGAIFERGLLPDFRLGDSSAVSREDSSYAKRIKIPSGAVSERVPFRQFSQTRNLPY